MGRKNIDRIPITEWRQSCSTVTKMRARGWEVVSRCRSCHLVMDVDLERMALELGPDFCLWDRQPPCRSRRCGGRVVFQARVPGKPLFENLVTDAGVG